MAAVVARMPNSVPAVNPYPLGALVCVPTAIREPILPELYKQLRVDYVHVFLDAAGAETSFFVLRQGLKKTLADLTQNGMQISLNADGYRWVPYHLLKPDGFWNESVAEIYRALNWTCVKWSPFPAVGAERHIMLAEEIGYLQPLEGSAVQLADWYEVLTPLRIQLATLVGQRYGQRTMVGAPIQARVGCRMFEEPGAPSYLSPQGLPPRPDEEVKL